MLRHFSGKDELLVAALAQRDEDEEKLAAQIQQSGMAGEGILGAVLRDAFEHPDYQRNWMALAIAATDPAHPAHPIPPRPLPRNPWAPRSFHETGHQPLGRGTRCLSGTADRVRVICGPPPLPRPLPTDSELPTVTTFFTDHSGQWTTSSTHPGAIHQMNE
jgi:AcrR family transcriptional regulator